MTVTFPRFGAASLVLPRFFETLQIPCIPPALDAEAALEAGREISPEEMCIPFKYMAGDLKDAYAKGADTVLMPATCGPCRLGEYGQLLMEVLEKAGCSFRWILLDSPSVIGPGELVRRFGSLWDGRRLPAARTAGALYSSFQLIEKVDAFWRKAEAAAGYLAQPYEAVKLLHETEQSLRDAEGFSDCFAALRRGRESLKRLERKEAARPVKVLVAGEIYTSVEPEANGRLEEQLMALGCSVQRHISVSWWLRHTAMQMLVPAPVREKVAGGGGKKRGMVCSVGGYGKETGDRILRAGQFDGIVKIMPVGCMPEIVTKAICERIQQEQGYRILHLIYDEHRGSGGYETRVEAFVDMLERRKNVLAGN